MANDNDEVNTPSAPLDINALVRAMLEQNRLREQQMDAIVNRLLDHKRNDPPVPSVVPNHEQIMPMFTGESGDTDAATEWVNALKTVALLNGWPDSYTLEAGRSHLGGAARHWYLSHMAELNTMDNFITSFEMMFTSQESITETWRKMDERVQQRGETVFAYFHDKVRMCRRLKLTATETKKMVCIGLKSREMCAAILSNSHTSEVELLADIRMYAEVHSNRSERYRSVSTHEKKNTTQTADKGGEKGSKPSTPEQPSYASFKKEQNTSKNTSAGPKCYNCQLIGHIARDCTRPKRPLHCSKCRAEGHTAKHCQAETTDIALIDDNTINRTLYIKRVQINDDPEEVQGLVDTGSALSIVKRSIAEKYGLTIKPRTVNLSVYGNTPCVIGGGDTKAWLKIDSVKEPVDLLVVDDHIQNYDMIIGRTFINKENVSFIKTSNQLIFDYNMPLPYNEEPNETITGQPANVEVMLIEREKKPITTSMVKHNQSFTKDEVTKLVNLLNEYRVCFAFNIFELGCTNALTMDIVDNNVPVVSRPYRASAAERDTIDKIVSEWKSAGLVTETKSAYASPVLLVRKKNGDPRLVVDYRKLNSQTIRKVFPTPHMDDHLEALSDARLFCTLDLASGYLQVPLTEEAKAKTSFITPTETGQFERMVFGLVNAPYEFSRLMQGVMQHLQRKVAMWYLDDILVPAKNFEDMILRLRKVLDVLRTANLTLKLEKCYFGYEEVTYLGYKISAEGIKPGMDKTSAIQDMKPPVNQHEVRRYLGLTGFFRRFVPRYAEIARPLTELLKDSVSFKWKAEQEQAFENLKHCITSSPALQLFNPSSYTELHCDASQVGLSGMLLQRGEVDKKMHLVHAVSKKTTTAEKNYHAGKLELMAIVWSITRLRHLLIGIPFTVITDCQAIVHLNTKRTVNPQVARWANLLSEYEFEVRHRPGTKMAHADALSRAPVDTSYDTEQELEDYEVLLAMTEEEHVMAMQRSDEKLLKIINNLEKRSEERSVVEDSMIKNYVLRKGILYRAVKVREETRQLWVVPDGMRKSMVVRCHDLSGHFAVDRTVSKIMERYYFARMRRYVRFHIKCCPECMLNKIPKGRQQGELHPIPPGKRPFEIIHLDHIGPFIKSTSGNNHILVLVDNLTKFVKLYAVRRCDTDSVIKCLKSFVLLHGLPKRIISDRGTAFTSRRFETYCDSGGIKHTLISVRHPQSNGQVERVNSTLVPVLQANMTNERNWDKKLLEVESQLNNSQNKTVGDTPFRVLYGYYPSFHDGVLRHITVTEEYDDVNKLQEQTRVNIEKEQGKWKNRYDLKHTRPVKYKVGEVVFLRRPAIHTGEPTKLQPKFRGPLIVNKVLPNDVYQVADVTVKEGRQYVTTAHASHLKVYRIGADCDEVPNHITDEQDQSTDSEERQTKEKEKTEAVPEQLTSRAKKKPGWLKDYTQ